MKQFTAEHVNQALDFPKLIDELSHSFCAEITVPPRLHYDMPNPKSSRETTLLMMPAWQGGDMAGIKLVTVAPENTLKSLPTIQGSYLLLDIDTGSVKAMMDAPVLTAKRTAAASALASKLLSRNDTSSMLMIGTGTLSIPLIEAHMSVRPISTVYIWGRTQEKANDICQQIRSRGIECNVVENIEQAIQKVDLISCATLSQSPLVFGAWLKAGQHVDMVGAYRPDMREMDDKCLLRGRIFVDNIEGATRETGDILIPLTTNVITRQDIEADLFDLCRERVKVNRQHGDITIFKSVGHALEDLTAAKLVYSYFE